VEMKKGIWKIGFVAALLGVVAIIGSACAPQASGVQQASSAAKTLFLNSDMVVGSGGTVKPATSCVLDSQYKRGAQVVWRIKVYDPATGKPLDDKALASVSVTLSDGEKFDAKYGGHPAKTPTDSFWATSWIIPDTYPTGSLQYTITAKSTDGRTGQFDNFNVAPSALTVVQ
jgi:hypothetical protein